MFNFKINCSLSGHPTLEAYLKRVENDITAGFIGDDKEGAIAHAGGDLRMILEYVTGQYLLKIGENNRMTTFDRLKKLEERRLLNKKQLKILHEIRKLGNSEVHEAEAGRPSAARAMALTEDFITAVLPQFQKDIPIELTTSAFPADSSNSKPPKHAYTPSEEDEKLYEEARKLEWDEEKYDVANCIYLTLAKKGHPDAQIQIALAYNQGRGIEHDYEKALYWCLKAAEQGKIFAQIFAGELYEEGSDSFAPDKKKALHWYQKAAYEQHDFFEDFLHNNGEGKWHIAKILEHGGDGIAVDKKKAFCLYLESAELGYEKAQYRVAQMYKNGIGTTVDREKAIEWLQEAAVSGHDEARMELEKMGIIVAKRRGQRRGIII